MSAKTDKNHPEPRTRPAPPTAPGTAAALGRKPPAAANQKLPARRPSACAPESWTASSSPTCAKTKKTCR